MKVTRRLIIVFFICPFNVMIVIPGLILLASSQTGLLAPHSWNFDLVRGILGILLITAGIIITYWCVSLFTDHGDGTPAPWDPPKHLVVRGIYRNVRNPMMEGVFCVLLGESLLSGSFLLLLWFLFFVITNLIYIPLMEEPELLRRFGAPYHLYMQKVSRWLPRKNPAASFTSI